MLAFEETDADRTRVWPFLPGRTSHGELSPSPFRDLEFLRLLLLRPVSLRLRTAARHRAVGLRLPPPPPAPPRPRAPWWTLADFSGLSTNHPLANSQETANQTCTWQSNAPRDTR
eukprot:gene18514-biopygen20452